MLDDAGLPAIGLAANFNAVPPALVSPTQYIEVVMTNLDICHDLGIPRATCRYHQPADRDSRRHGL